MPGSGLRVVDVYGALQLQVFQQEAVQRAVTAAGEGLGEPVCVQLPGVLLLQVTAAEKLDVGLAVLGEELRDLVWVNC